MYCIKLLSITFSLYTLIACSDSTAANAGKTNPSSDKPLQKSGNDFYYEMTTTATGKKMKIDGLTKMFVSAKGDLRTEMMLHNSLSGTEKEVPIILIGHSDKPDESISIDDAAKTYTINHIDRDELNVKENIQSTATRVGEEKVSGFNCVHARIISNKSMGGFFSITDTLDLWRSSDVPMPASVQALMEQLESRTGNFMYSQPVADQLKKMGCTGFLVKLTIRSKSSSTTMQLIKAEQKNLSAGLFQVPAGYTEEKE